MDNREQQQSRVKMLMFPLVKTDGYEEMEGGLKTMRFYGDGIAQLTINLLVRANESSEEIGQMMNVVFDLSELVSAGIDNYDATMGEMMEESSVICLAMTGGNSIRVTVMNDLVDESMLLCKLLMKMKRTGNYDLEQFALLEKGGFKVC